MINTQPYRIYGNLATNSAFKGNKLLPYAPIWALNLPTPYNASDLTEWKYSLHQPSTVKALKNNGINATFILNAIQYLEENKLGHFIYRDNASEGHIRDRARDSSVVLSRWFGESLDYCYAPFSNSNARSMDLELLTNALQLGTAAKFRTNHGTYHTSYYYAARGKESSDEIIHEPIFCLAFNPKYTRYVKVMYAGREEADPRAFRFFVDTSMFPSIHPTLAAVARQLMDICKEVGVEVVDKANLVDDLYAYLKVPSIRQILAFNNWVKSAPKAFLASFKPQPETEAVAEVISLTPKELTPEELAAEAEALAATMTQEPEMSEEDIRALAMMAAEFAATEGIPGVGLMASGGDTSDDESEDISDEDYEESDDSEEEGLEDLMLDYTSVPFPDFSETTSSNDDTN